MNYIFEVHNRITLIMFVEGDAEIDQILAQAEGIDRRALQEILESVGTLTTTKANVHLEGVAPGEGAMAYCGMEGTLARGPFHSWHLQQDPFLTVSKLPSLSKHNVSYCLGQRGARQ